MSRIFKEIRFETNTRISTGINYILLKEGLFLFHTWVVYLQINIGEKYFVKLLGLLIRVTNSYEICKHKSKKSHCRAKYAAHRFQIWWSMKCM